MLLKAFKVFVFLLISFECAQALIVNSCASKPTVMDCTSNNPDFKNTVIIEEAIYGYSNSENAECVQKPGDCVDETTKFCGTSEKCTIIANANYKLKNPDCEGKIANYLQIEYSCVPFTYEKFTYDISTSENIENNKGIIISPGYPTYKSQSGLIYRKIVVPKGYSINIWIHDLSIKKRDANKECGDYLMVSDVTGQVKICGAEKQNFVGQFCSNEIYIAYRAVSPNALYKGFKLYFEYFKTSDTCPTGPAIVPSEEMTTTFSPLVTTTKVPELGALTAFPLTEFRFCKGQMNTFKVPNDNYIFFIENYYYGFSHTSEPAACTTQNPADCLAYEKTPYCNYGKSCQINFLNDVKLGSCANNLANYLYLTYRFVPIRSSVTYQMGSTSVIDASQNPVGIVTSKNYPSYQQIDQGEITIRTSDTTKAFKLYIVDIFVDSENVTSKLCQRSIITISDDQLSYDYCGLLESTKRIYTFSSCSNQVKISLKANSPTPELAAIFRGFKIYYEMINSNGNCVNLQTTKLSTISPKDTTTTPKENTLAFSSILTVDNKKCSNQFIFGGQTYENCIKRDDNYYFCSTTGSADQDKSQCVMSQTENIITPICARKSKTLKCPANYVIFIQSAQYALTSTGTCDDTNFVCQQTDFGFSKTACAGKNTCTINAAALTIIGCDKSPNQANLLQVDFVCLPDNVIGFAQYDVCGGDNSFDTKGIITTPSYPNPISDKSCTKKVTFNKVRYVTVYSVNVELGTTPIISARCTTDFLTINDGQKECGSIKTAILYEGCTNTIKVDYTVGAKAYKGFKLYYESYEDDKLCSQTPPTPTIQQTTQIMTTSKPDYAIQGIASKPNNFYACKGKEKAEIGCPENYIMAFRNRFYGVSGSTLFGSCVSILGDCTSAIEGPEVLDCQGYPNCKINYSPLVLPNCKNKTSDYLKIEYDCIPTNAIVPAQPACDRPFTGKNGIIRTAKYPTYENGLNCLTEITVPDATKAIKVYIMDLSINPDTNSDRIEIIDPYLTTTFQAYGEEKTSLVYTSCINTITLRIVTGGSSSPDYRGMLLYYEQVDKPLIPNFSCKAPTSPTTTTSTTIFTGTTPTTSTLPPPSYSGFASPIATYTACANVSIACPAGFTIIAQGSIRANNAQQCAFNPDDCSLKYATIDSLCSAYGKNKCDLYVNPKIVTMKNCANNATKGDYVYVTYQCVPIENADKPPRPNVEMCSEGADYTVKPNGAKIFQTPNYPSYPTDQKSCTQNITTDPGYVLVVYLTDANFQESAITDCEAKTSNYLILTDESATHQYCGQINYAKYVFTTNSNYLNFKMLIKNKVTALKSRGAKIFVEAISASQVTGTVTTITSTKPPTKTPANYNGMASPILHSKICSNTYKLTYCPSDYLIVILEEYLISTGMGCQHSSNECRQRITYLTESCSGENECNYYFPVTSMTNCARRFADILDFDYQCIPTKPATGVSTYTCNSEEIKNVKQGFITSPDYETYNTGVSNCKIKISAEAGYGIRIYALDISLPSPNQNGCRGPLEIEGAGQFCGSMKANQLFESDTNQVTLNYNSLNPDEYAQLGESLRGFKLYFETYSLKSTGTPRPPITRTPRTTPTPIEKKKNSGGLLGSMLGIGVPLLVVIAFLAYYINRDRFGGNINSIGYSKKQDNKINADLTSFASPLNNE